jgi:hypothetical protein
MSTYYAVKIWTYSEREADTFCLQWETGDRVMRWPNSVRTEWPYRRRLQPTYLSRMGSRNV